MEPAFEAVAGFTYEFEALLRTLEGSVIELRDDSGNLVVSQQSPLTWTATSDGTFSIVVKSNDPQQVSGSYWLLIREVVDVDVQTGTLALDDDWNDYHTFTAVEGATFEFERKVGVF